MTGIKLTDEQFKAAQSRLASFLESKYNIKKQSKGLMEYGAAFMLGYDNHHQLNKELGFGTEPKKDATFHHNQLLRHLLHAKGFKGFVLDHGGEYDYSVDESVDIAKEYLKTHNYSLDKVSRELGLKIQRMVNQPVHFSTYLLTTRHEYEAQSFENIANNWYENLTSSKDRDEGLDFFDDVVEWLCKAVFNPSEVGEDDFYGVFIVDDHFSFNCQYTKNELIKLFESLPTANDRVNYCIEQWCRAPINPLV